VQVRDWLVRSRLGELVTAFEVAGMTGRSLGGMVRIARCGGATSLREMLRDELGVTRLATQLEFIDELFRLWD
jgi:hypothetical protein